MHFTTGGDRQSIAETTPVRARTPNIAGVDVIILLIVADSDTSYAGNLRKDVAGLLVIRRAKVLAQTAVYRIPIPPCQCLRLES